MPIPEKKRTSLHVEVRPVSVPLLSFPVSLKGDARFAPGDGAQGPLAFELDWGQYILIPLAYTVFGINGSSD
jgi:hypothetical protein